MNERKVIKIDVPIRTPKLHSITNTRKKRVCAYARVSTDFEDQLNSYNAQIDEYTKRINDNPNWEFKGMFADEGISGTSIKKRIEFQKMIDEARKGNIDLILTKSLSRFARNTVDCLSIIQEMRSINVEIFFEKENIYSSDPKVDFMLTIFSSIAQEEARNISDNVKWGIRKRFQEGKVFINTRRFLGYDKNEEGKIVINKKEAQTIKLIFNLYISGLSLKEIVDHLTKNEIPNGRGVVFWQHATVMSILTNEKYCGDVLLQKRVVLDYLTHKSVKNDGHAPQYYIMNNHEPIIPREMFEIVQQVKKNRSNNTNRSKFANQYPLSGIVHCGCCNRVLNRNYYNYRTKYQRVVLTCKNSSKVRIPCENKPIDNSTLEGVCSAAIKNLKIVRPEVVDEIINTISSSLDSGKVFAEISVKKEEINKRELEIKELINLRIANDKTINDKYLIEAFEDKKKEIEMLNIELSLLQEDLANTHVNKDRLDKFREFINETNIISRDALTIIFKRIIEINSNEVILCMSSLILSNDEFSNKLQRLKKYIPILESEYTNKELNITINYKIIEFGNEIND